MNYTPKGGKRDISSDEMIKGEESKVQLTRRIPW